MNLLFLNHPVDLVKVSVAVILVLLAVKFEAAELNRRKMTTSTRKKRYAPVAGTVLNMLANFERLHDYMTEIAITHKTYRFLNLFQSEVFTSDPANVEYILKTNFDNFPKGPFHYNILKDLLGDGIFTVDGEMWRHQRKTSSYEFSTKNLRDFSTEVFLSKAIRLSRIVSEAASSSRTIEIQDLFMKSTLDSVFKVVLGVELDSIGKTNGEEAEFTKAFDEANALTYYRYVDLFWEIKRFLNIGSEAKLRARILVVNKFVYKIIGKKTEEFHNTQDKQVMKKDLLSRFLELQETDPKYLKDIILSFIIAGKDTTASTLSWFFYMICKHPLVQEKIAREVQEATQLKTDLCIDDIRSSMNEEAINRMQYLHATLTETMRLYPVVPVDGKVCLSDDTLPDGVSVRRGDQMGYQAYVMGRMKRIWGDDAEEFRPERWLNEDGVFVQQSSFMFTAFQAGPRICLGKEFAYRQMKIFAAIMISSFSFALSDEQRTVKYKTMLTLQIDGGLRLSASHRLT